MPTELVKRKAVVAVEKLGKSPRRVRRYTEQHFKCMVEDYLRVVREDFGE